MQIFISKVEKVSYHTFLNVRSGNTTGEKGLVWESKQVIFETDVCYR